MGITGFNAAQYARTSRALERVLRQIEANAWLRSKRPACADTLSRDGGMKMTRRSLEQPSEAAHARRLP
jgi:hypothetical protein